MTNFQSWFLLHYQEILGTILALISLYYQTIQHKWLWPFSIISSAIFAYIFFIAEIYADMSLQLYYVVISIYGWYVWSKMQENSNGKGEIQSIFKIPYLGIKLIAITSIIFIAISQLLIYYTNSTVPYFDAFVTSLSITATWMLARKYLEHWLVWIFVDLISTGLYFYKGLYVTILLYIVYTVFAVIGYVIWLKSFNEQSDLLQSNYVVYNKRNL